MTIGRRNLFGLSALGLGAAALEGCGGALVPGSGAAMGPAEVESLLTELDEVMAQLEVLDAEPSKFGIQGHGPEVTQGRERCIGLLTTLCFMGTYRDVPESVWREPKVAAHLAKSLPRVQAVVAGAREHLAGMTDEEIAAVDERFLREPDLPMRIMERIDGFAKDLDVPMEQRTYLRLSTVQLAARFRYEGTKEVTGKVASTFGRVLDSRIAELGLDRDAPAEGEAPGPRRRAPGSRAARGNLLGVPTEAPRGLEGESCVTDTDCDSGLDCLSGECTAPTETRSKQLIGTVGDVAVVGAYLLIPPLCAIGVMVLLVCLFMTIVAGLVHAGGD